LKPAYNFFVDIFLKKYSNSELEASMNTSKVMSSKILRKKRSLKLNLGCGRQYLKGYINIDIRNQHVPGIDPFIVDKYMDITKIPYQFKTNSIEKIYCHHVLEHFQIKIIRPMLKEWHRILKKGGGLEIGVPNFEDLVIIFNMLSLQARGIKPLWKADEFMFQNFWNRQEIKDSLFGRMDYPADSHICHFDKMFLRKLLREAGFLKIEIINVWNGLNAKAIKN